MSSFGVFGGTFDPPHMAHLALAAEAKSQLELERVLWVLTPYPPHKRGQVITPLEARLEMLQAALEGEAGFEISCVDMDRPAPHYAVDTVRLLKEIYPGEELVYLVGGDSLRDLPRWHRPVELVTAVDAFGVMRRPRTRIDLDALEVKLPGLRAKLRFFDAPRLEISASDIRRRIAAGAPYEYMLPEAVRRLIREKELYDWGRKKP